MRSFVRSLCVVLFLASVTVAGDNRLDDVIKGMLDAMANMNGILSKIQDEDSAMAARPDLKKVAGEWAALRKKADNTSPPNKEEKERVAKEYRSKIEDAQKKLFAEIGRVQLVPGGKEALADLTKVLAPQKKKPPSP